MSEQINCIDCTHYKIIPDPDPHDWFNDDDVAVICNHEASPENGRFSPEAKFQADRQKKSCVTVSCRPHHVRKESGQPDWCPLLNRREGQA